MDNNFEHQHQPYLKIRDFLLEYFDANVDGFCSDMFAYEPWSAILLRDLPHDDDAEIGQLSLDFDWDILCEYEWALPFIEQHLERADWTRLSRAPWAAHLLDANPDKVDCISIFANPICIDAIDGMDCTQLPDDVRSELCRNPAAIDTIRKLPFHRLDLVSLAANEAALPLLEELLMLLPPLALDVLSQQPWALPIIRKYPAVEWDWDFLGTQPWAMPAFTENMIFAHGDSGIPLGRLCGNSDAWYWFHKYRMLFDRIDRRVFEMVPAFIADLEMTGFVSLETFDPSNEMIMITHCKKNPLVMPMIKALIDRYGEDDVCVELDIWSNPGVITYNYAAIRKDRQWARDALTEWFYHPNKIAPIVRQHGPDALADYNPIAE